MKAKILSMLRETDGYISGQQLCEEFHVSRTAVWKVIEQLKTEGYKIEAVRNRGYHLEETPDVMSKAEIESLISTKWAGCGVLYFPEIDSTNTYAKRLGDGGADHGTLVVSDKQTAGKGRRGRAWESPSGSSIYMSILLRPEITPNQAPMLTLVMAQSVAQAIRKITGEEAMIKWPNDIVLNKKKICGMLTEMSTEIAWINYVVIGVGINVNTESFPEELNKKATSLYLESGRKIQRSQLIAESMRQFEHYYELFIETGNLSAMQEDYNRLLVNRDRDVRIMEPGNEYNGHAIGINETGELLVCKEDGQIAEIYAGEVSVRGIYGYV
ncbi:MAG: biotin--[acetyl-CoA-carboxylase] ligase [Eubacteriales bacterium]|nr:biotin--[acetyl-CoA-carboxylase] ligase [Eubacteriales bacterium]